MNGKFNVRMDTVRAFFLQNQGTFFDFQKRAGEVSPPSPPSCAPASPFLHNFWKTETEIPAQHNPYHVLHQFLYHVLPIQPHAKSIGYSKPNAHISQSHLLSWYIHFIFRYYVTLYGSHTIIKKLNLQEPLLFKS